MPRLCRLHRNLPFCPLLCAAVQRADFLPAQASSDVLFCSFLCHFARRLFCRINAHHLHASLSPGYHSGYSSLARELFFPEVVT
jgi:hypothetical protein